VRFKGGGVASAGGHEAFDLRDGVNAAAGADSGAIECGSGAGEIELLLQRPTLQKRVDKSGMKNIACAGGIDGLDPKSISFRAFSVRSQWLEELYLIVASVFQDSR
jgi:hypothetical protein